MARRDRLRELIEIKQRTGRWGGSRLGPTHIKELAEAWSNCTCSRELFAGLLPARIVTLIEVFSRRWIEDLIDRGSPFVERAADLKTDIKYDLALVRSLQGQTISLGLIFSHSVPLSQLESIASVFSTLLQRDFFELLQNVRPRSFEDEGDSAPPIVTDIGRLKRILARTFEVRHILVHELPEAHPFGVAEIDEMIAAADTFLTAADDVFFQLHHGTYQLTQQASNNIAHDESKATDERLEPIVAEVAARMGSDKIHTVQQAWRAFAEAEANREAELYDGGSMQPSIYYSVLTALSRDRIRQLQHGFKNNRSRRRDGIRWARCNIARGAGAGPQRRPVGRCTSHLAAHQWQKWGPRRVN
jgi:uncharacterized protein YecT (DUF1311 family)